MKVELRLTSPTSRSFRAASVEGRFDVPHQPEQVVEITAELPLEDEEWSVGAIVGASGTGKSSIARAAFGDQFVEPGSFQWTADCLLDDFPDGLTPAEIASLLTSVGLSSTPVWLRPYRVLSTGQRFRAELARALAVNTSVNISPPVIAFDEFTSVVDRTVAKAASVAIAKHARRSGTRFVAVTCHHDVLPWLEADWVYDTDRGSFYWARGRLQRPGIPLRLRAGTREAWPLFRGHHYLTRTIAPGARILLAYVELDGVERLAGFFSMIPRLMHRGSDKSWLRGHRTVVLPDYQGLGIGNRMVELGAEQLWQQKRIRYSATTAAPALIAHRRQHPEMWQLSEGPSMKGPSVSRSRKIITSAGRLTTTWIYLPEEMRRR